MFWNFFVIACNAKELTKSILIQMISTIMRVCQVVWPVKTDAIAYERWFLIFETYLGCYCEPGFIRTEPDGQCVAGNYVDLQNPRFKQVISVFSRMWNEESNSNVRRFQLSKNCFLVARSYLSHSTISLRAQLFLQARLWIFFQRMLRFSWNHSRILHETR